MRFKSDEYYNYWLNQLDLWTEDNAITLICGLEPVCGNIYEASSLYYQSVEQMQCFEKVTSIMKSSLAARTLHYDNNCYTEKTFKPKNIIKWAIDKNLTIPLPLREWYEKQTETVEQPIEQTQKTPSGTNHHSELLNIMNEAIAELWENHDPENPPTFALVEAWIKEKRYNCSQVEITAIDKIMRPYRYKGGKNKS